MMFITIRDNVHGDIRIEDEVVYELIDTPEFQRLRRISQLGGGQFAFIGATHTRFAHCLGVYHLISRFFKNKKIISSETFKDEKNRLIVKVAGLLHDIGHGPYSHSFENISDNSINHEHYSAKIIKTPTTNINKILQKYNINPEEVADIVEGKSKNNLMNSLVSSQLDADRLDYLLRDSRNAGVSYSIVDVDWIIRHIDIRDEKFVFPIKTIYAIEAYLLGRYHMYKQIYSHKISLGFDIAINKWFKRFNDLNQNNFEFKNIHNYDLLKPLLEKREYTTEEYQKLDDYSFMWIVAKTQDEDDEILSDLAFRIINRHFLEVLIVDSSDVILYKEKYTQEQLEYYFYEKSVSAISIYNKKNKKGKDELIYILDQDETIKDIKEFSDLLNVDPKEKNKKIIFVLEN